MDRNIKVKHLLTAIALIMFVGLMGATEGYLMGNFNGNGYLRVSGGTTSTFTAGTNSPIIPGAPFETLYYKASSGTNADTLVKAVRMPDETWVAVDCLLFHRVRLHGKHGTLLQTLSRLLLKFVTGI